MKSRMLALNIATIIRQRNISLIFLSFLMVVNFILSAHILMSSDRVIVVGPDRAARFWVEKNKIDEKYLEEMAYFITETAFNVSPENVQAHYELLVSWADPSYSNELKSRFEEFYRTMDAMKSSFSFKPKSIDTDVNLLAAKVKGDFASYVGADKVEKVEKVILIQFKIKNGQLSITKLDEYKEAEE